MSHNRQLDGLLSEVRQTAENAGDEQAFASVFSRLRDFLKNVGPIRYDNSLKWYICAVIAGCGGGFAFLYFTNLGLQSRLGDLGLVILGAFALALLVMLLVIGSANGAIDEISDLIFKKDVSFDNRLEEIDVEDRGADLYQRFKEEFGDFRARGDESRYVDRLVKGAWTGKEHSFPYEFYDFHYVEVYYVPVTRKVGNTMITTMERRTRTCYRHGLILDFPFAKGFAAASGGGSFDYPAGFQPTSEPFNETFATSAESAQAAAKFLKPAVVLAFLEASNAFSGLNVEVNRNGRMNIAFSDDDVLDLDRKFSIAQPDEFEREIQAHLELPKLRLLLQFVETLKKHNDSNF